MRLIYLAAALLLVSAAAHSQAGPSPWALCVVSTSEHLKGVFFDPHKISRTEAKAKHPVAYAHFDEIDVAHKGTITAGDIAHYLCKDKQQ